MQPDPCMVCACCSTAQHAPFAQNASMKDEFYFVWGYVRYGEVGRCV